jgi:hypothetical protein
MRGGKEREAAYLNQSTKRAPRWAREWSTVAGSAWWLTVERFWGRWREGGKIWGEARWNKNEKMGGMHWFWFEIFFLIYIYIYIYIFFF